MLKSHEDTEGLAELQRQLHKSDKHIILSRLMASELKALHPLLRERKNFSIVVDDWWCMPNWFMRTAEYIIFRNYNGIAARLGHATLVDGAQPPILLKPSPPYAPYNIAAAALRIPALAAWPLIDLWSGVRRAKESITPERFLYFPFPISDADVPLRDEKLQYDFANTGGTCGIWLVRDPFASAKYTFANLYYDRERLTNLIGKFENNPFAFYECRRGGEFRLPFDQYAAKNRQSRFVITTGGLHNTSVPKYLEYACLGTPAIGSLLPFEFPWLEDCLFPVDIMNLNAEQLKPRLHEALERYPVYRENCLGWRDRLLQLYDINRLLDMLQDQAHGQPIPPGYLKTDVKQINPLKGTRQHG
jgi:hypothetical protein